MLLQPVGRDNQSKANSCRREQRAKKHEMPSFSLPLLILLCNMLIQCFCSHVPGMSAPCSARHFFEDFLKILIPNVTRLPDLVLTQSQNSTKFPFSHLPCCSQLRQDPSLPHPRIPQSRFYRERITCMPVGCVVCATTDRRFVFRVQAVGRFSVGHSRPDSRIR